MSKKFFFKKPDGSIEYLTGNTYTSQEPVTVHFIETETNEPCISNNKRFENLRGCFNDTGITSTNYKDQMQWTSVDEKLPDQHGWYLVFTDRVEILYFEGEKGSVRYWMPLPEPPKEQNEVD